VSFAFSGGDGGVASTQIRKHDSIFIFLGLFVDDSNGDRSASRMLMTSSPEAGGGEGATRWRNYQR